VQIQLAESSIENSVKQVTPPSIVPIYYFVNPINYECENIWSLLSTRITQETRRKKRGYFQEQIPVQNSGSSIEVKD
jgi:hypothetical protein